MKQNISVISALPGSGGHPSAPRLRVSYDVEAVVQGVKVSIFSKLGNRLARSLVGIREVARRFRHYHRPKAGKGLMVSRTAALDRPRGFVVAKNAGPHSLQGLVTESMPVGSGDGYMCCMSPIDLC